MITRRITIRKYNWAVTLLLECNCSFCLEICEHLKTVGCPDKSLLKLKKELKRSRVYSAYHNIHSRRSIFIIPEYSSERDKVNIANLIDSLISVLSHTANVTPDLKIELHNTIYEYIMSIIKYTMQTY